MNDELRMKRHQYIQNLQSLSDKKVNVLAVIWDMQSIFNKDSEQYQSLEQAQNLILNIELDVPEFNIAND